MNKQLLIFDLDGTLIDSVPDLADATNAMLTDFDLSTANIDEVRHWVGNGAKKLIERALSDKTGKQPTDKQVEQGYQLFLEHYANKASNHTTAYQGVDDGLHKLKQAGYTLALVTNKPIRFVPAILDNFGWTQLFAITLGGDSLSEKKPNPLPLNHVCNELKFHVEQSYMIGDSKNDILAGQNAGMDTLGLSYGYNYGQDIRDFNPTQAFDNFSDMVAFLLAG